LYLAPKVRYNISDASDEDIWKPLNECFWATVLVLHQRYKVVDADGSGISPPLLNYYELFHAI
jgi:hypothetical protein